MSLDGDSSWKFSRTCSSDHRHELDAVRGKTLLSEKNDRGPRGTISCIIVSPGIAVFIALGYSLSFLLGNLTNYFLLGIINYVRNSC